MRLTHAACPLLTAAIMLAGSFLLPVPARAVPILDANVPLADPTTHPMPAFVRGAGYFPAPNDAAYSPGNVFQSINGGWATSIDLFVSSKSFTAASPLYVELWTATEGSLVDGKSPTGGLGELLATSQTLPVDEIPESNVPRSRSFVFDQPTALDPGNWYGWRVIAGPAGAVALGNYNLVPNNPDNLSFKLWVNPDWIDPNPLPIPGDVDGNLVVDLSDFGILKGNFGKAGATAADGDLDGNGTVDLTDFGLLKENFGKAGAAAAPEPSGLALVGVGAGAILLRVVGGRGRR